MVEVVDTTGLELTEVTETFGGAALFPEFEEMTLLGVVGFVLDVEVVKVKDPNSNPLPKG